MFPNKSTFSLWLRLIAIICCCCLLVLSNSVYCQSNGTQENESEVEDETDSDIEGQGRGALTDILLSGPSNFLSLVKTVWAPKILSEEAKEFRSFMFDILKHPLTDGDDIMKRLIKDLSQFNTSLVERPQNKHLALTDHKNDVIFDSTTQQIIERSGFRQVTHYTTSADGYITQLINVINPLADRSQLKQPPMMIFHGGIVDPTTWVMASAIDHHPERYPRTMADGPITSSNRSLGFMLTNYGYDVWLVATRGCNRDNMGHTILKAKLLEEKPPNVADTFKYFDYSQDELVEKEFPAQIQRVLELTGSTKVSTITYSFSSQILFKILASNKDIASKIYTNCALQPLLDKIGMSTFVAKAMNIAAVAPNVVGTLFSQLLFRKSTRILNRSLQPRYDVTRLVVNSLCGPSPKYQTFLEDPVLGHILMPVAAGEYKHFGQQIHQGRLQKLDHGPSKNLKLYGQKTPPIYKLEDINIKRWMLVSGDTDTLGTQSSADKFAAQIPFKPYNHVRITGGWNHLDTVAAFNNDVMVNLPILEFFDYYSSLNKTEIDLAD